MGPRPGIVVIGRNEGDRLKRCLESLVGGAGTIVYVDSGSTDGSVAAAKALGAHVVELPPDQPFTAARARNAGLERLLALDPEQEYVQFVDGDCRVDPGWLDAAAAQLGAYPKLAAVCGRRREVSPDDSVYNRLCDLEWDTPIGEAKSCGGDAMMRASALREVGGFDPSVIAGEEPDLCVRLRARGWTILRLNAEMTLHDAAMTRFGQWWRRSVRAGHAYAEGAARHGRPPERHWVRDVRSIVVWGGLFPLAAVAAAWPTAGLSLVALPALYAVQVWRIARSQRRRGRPASHARLYAFFTVLGKFAQLQGVLWYWTNRLRGRKTGIIEYKGALRLPRPESGSIRPGTAP
jgi:GT2 family glycosyltransferase